MLHFAGVIDTHSIPDTTVAHWNRVININLLGTFLMVQAVSAVRMPMIAAMKVAMVARAAMAAM